MKYNQKDKPSKFPPNQWDRMIGSTVLAVNINS